MTRKTVHVHLNVRGALAWPDKRLRNLVSDENGDRFKPAQVRAWLRSQLDEGREALPIGKPCKGFDYKTGCPGHPAPSSSIEGAQ